MNHPAESLVMQALALTPRGEDEPVADHLGRQAAAIVATLIGGGYVAEYDPAADLERVARDLATASRHNRFILVEDGWRQLLESEQMVDMAHHQALLQSGAHVPTLNGYRDVLVGYHRGRAAHA